MKITQDVRHYAAELNIDELTVVKKMADQFTEIGREIYSTKLICYSLIKRGITCRIYLMLLLRET